MVFGIVRNAMGIRPLPEGAPRGFQVSLSAAVAWAVRETRLHQPHQNTLEVNLKLDGRLFFGRCEVFLLQGFKCYLKFSQLSLMVLCLCPFSSNLHGMGTSCAKEGFL